MKERLPEPPPPRDSAAPETVKQAIEAAVTDAVRKLASDSLETARYPYFAPRRLGATAPQDCSIWRVDYRDTPEAQSSPDYPTGLRTLEEPETLTELNRLLEAGLQVKP